MADEAPDYEVLRHDGSFELRRYAGYLTANVRVTALDYNRAMNAGFDPVADFIFGNNHVADRISMTAPVTARRSEDEYVVSFTMPSGYSLETPPRPNNTEVSIEPVDSHLAAVVRFGGKSSGTKAAQAQTQLKSWIEEQGLVALGESVVAQYDPPWKPGFARRSEVMIVVDQA
ncbi:MAG: heme-binding protein [Coriobacteriia bacterium]|nr:heme-binding protein [Coriobacteriia bacterium]